MTGLIEMMIEMTEMTEILDMYDWSNDFIMEWLKCWKMTELTGK